MDFALVYHEFGRVDINDLLNPQDEDDVLEIVTGEQLAQSVVVDVCPTLETEDEAASLSHFPVAESLMDLAHAREIIESSGLFHGCASR